VAVVSVSAKTYIGDHTDVRHGGFDLGNGFLNDAVLGVGPGPQFIFFTGDSKEYNGRNTCIFCLFCLFHNMIAGELKLTGHCINWFFDRFAFNGK